MTARPLGEQDFVVHAFALVDGPRADDAYDEVRRLWEGCRRELGMTQPIRGTGLRTSLPGERADLPDEAEVAGLESPDGDFQAIVRRDQEMLCLAVLLAPQNRPVGRHAAAARRDEGAMLNWMQLDRRWSSVAGPESEVLLGEVRLYLGRMAADASADTEAAGAGAGPASGAGIMADGSVRAAEIVAPYVHWLPQDEGWMDRGVMLEQGVAVWETTFRDERRARRRIVALADHGKSAEESAWFWSHGDAEMPPFGAYLRYMAEIRYELRVWDDGRRPRALRDRADAGVGQVRRLLEGGGGAPAAGEMASVLRRLRVDELDMVVASTALREMRHAVVISTGNMRTVAKGVGGGVRGGRNVLAGDPELADWFKRRLEDAVRSLDSARDRAREVRALAGGHFDERAGPGVRDVLGGEIEAGEGNEMKEEVEKMDVSRKVFVVYGRDDAVQEKVFGFLFALGLEPREWEPLVADTGSTLPTLTDVVVKGLSPGQAQAVVVILTPDDVVHLHPNLHSENEQSYETDPVMQSRPNVLIEVGLALAGYRDRTIIVEIGRLRPIADLAGLNVIRFDGSDVAIGKLVQRLKLAGCAVNDQGSEWRKTSRFAGLDAYTRRPDVSR